MNLIKSTYRALINTNKQIRAYKQYVKELGVIAEHANIIMESIKTMNASLKQ